MKRLYKRAGIVRVHAANRAYAPITFVESQEMDGLGRGHVEYAAVASSLKARMTTFALIDGNISMSLASGASIYRSSENRSLRLATTTGVQSQGLKKPKRSRNDGTTVVPAS